MERPVIKQSIRLGIEATATAFILAASFGVVFGIGFAIVNSAINAVS